MQNRHVFLDAKQRVRLVVDPPDSLAAVHATAAGSHRAVVDSLHAAASDAER